MGSRYRIISLLGQGGMGDVFRAEHIGLGKEIALKVLRKHSPEWQERFSREAHAIARLDHPGCVRILDHGKNSTGNPFLAMELVEGPTLAREIASSDISLDRALHIARALLSALAHAHAHGIVHRDVKPENVILGPRGRVVLIDFGLASLRDTAPLTGSGFVFGSPSYIAPERLRGEPNDARGDLYSVGVILYEMITGVRPFLGGSPQEIMANALTRPPRPLRVLAPDVPAAIDELLKRALAKDPDRRFGDAEEMLSELDALMDTAPRAEVASEPEPSASVTCLELVARPPSPWRRLWAWLRYGAWRWRVVPHAE